MTAEDKAVIDNNDWSEVYGLGDSHLKQGKWQQAALAFQRAIELRAGFFWSYHHLGDALTKLQQWNQAAIAYSQAVKIDPSFFWSWHNLGDVLTKLQQKEKAIAVYLQAMELKIEDQLVAQKLGTAFKQQGSLTNAIKYYCQLLRSPAHNSIYHRLQNKPQTLLQIAQTLEREHQTHGAIILYYMSLELKPNQTSILLKLAELLQQQNQLQQNIIQQQQNLQSELLDRQQTKTRTQPSVQNLPGKILLKSNSSVSPHQLEELCATVGWSPRSLDQVQKSLDHSFCHIAAWHWHHEQSKLIGFARAVSDAAFHATLLDIVVHPQFQNRGLGKKIVKALLNHLQAEKIQDITLFASPHIIDFYHQLGFVAQPNNLQWMLWSGK